jgi:hypothetical protein
VWLAVAAAVVLVALVGALALLGDDQVVDTNPVNEVPTPTPTSVPGWSGPVRAPSDVVHRSTVDPLDASVGWADMTLVTSESQNAGFWRFRLAEAPPRVEDQEPGVVIAYGLTFDTDADGAADYVVGVDSDATQRGQLRAWVTDLATGETDMQDGPPYGHPIEFGYPTVAEPDIEVFLTFLRGSEPADLSSDQVRFYAWTSVARDGVVFAHDYAPDTGWASRDGR